MINARRYECFCVDPAERWMFAGNLSGQISSIDIDAFTIVHELQAHAGVMRALVMHPSLPYVAGLATDRCVSIWRYTHDGSLHPVAYTPIRDIPCLNDEYALPPVISHSIALGFHDTERRLVTRTGSGGVLELDFTDDGDVTVRASARLHGDWDVQMTRYVSGSDLVLSGGRDATLVVSDRGREVRRVRFGHAVVHWAEHMHGSTYLIASDMGYAARIDLATDDDPVVGERFARDDMEYITYNKTSGRAFATSFDRNVYEVDPETCNSKGVAYTPGYKCIWVKSLERSPSTLIVQSRNGGLYKGCADTGRTLAVIKQTPDCLWSGVNLDGGEVLLAGEGSHFTWLRPAAVDPTARKRLFTVERLPLDIPADTYTKRLVRQPVTGRLVLGRTNGEIWVGDAGHFRRLIDLGSAVRDVGIASEGDDVFACTEDGRALRIDFQTGEVLLTYQSEGEPFPAPVWALAHNPARNLLATAERGGTIRIFSVSDFSQVDEFEAQRVKRIRWVNPDMLLFNNIDEIHRYELGGKPELHVASMLNTIEDFIWDPRGQYLVAISYQCTIALCDFETGNTLDVARDQMDYSKGLTWLESASDARLYPWDFITWGRSGAAHHFRIHDEKIMALGPIGVAPD